MSLMIENNNKIREKIKENKIKETKFSSVLLFIGLGILILIVRFTMTIFNKNDYYNKWIKKALDRYNSVYRFYFILSFLIILSPFIFLPSIPYNIPFENLSPYEKKVKIIKDIMIQTTIGYIAALAADFDITIIPVIFIPIILYTRNCISTGFC